VSRQVGSLWVVPLPSMNVTNSNSNTVRTCADFARYVGQPPESVTGLVLDLRGNQGGPLTDSSCLASLFLKKGQELFGVTDKQGKLVKYESEPAGRNLADVPLAVLIDNHTDSGGLLVAAILQDHHRASVIGEQNPAVNGAVSALVFPPGANRGIILPTGEIVLPGKRPLAAGVRVDVPMAAHDDNALMNVALSYVAKR
jgi:C-terminal processing protease CtpA/Prc